MENNSKIDKNISQINKRQLKNNNEENEKNEISNTSNYQAQLKVLLKHKFLSLSLENLYAFTIQFNWRNYFISKNNKENSLLIEIIYENGENNIKNIINNCTKNKYAFKLYELQKYIKLKEVTKNLKNENGIFIFIGGFLIGSEKEFDFLLRGNYIKKILNKEYKETCLNCGIGKSYENNIKCPLCEKDYMFFSLSKKKYDIWNSRK